MIQYWVYSESHFFWCQRIDARAIGTKKLLLFAGVWVFKIGCSLAFFPSLFFGKAEDLALALRFVRAAASFYLKKRTPREVGFGDLNKGGLVKKS